MRIRHFILTATLVVSHFIYSQSGVQKETYQAFLNNDETRWRNVTTKFEKSADLNESADLLQLINYYYCYVSVLIDKQMDKQADENIRKAEVYISKVLKSEPNNALGINYKGIFQSYQVSLNKMKAATMGKQILGNLNKAYSLDPNSVQILFDRGNSFYYPPKVLGGNKKEALNYFQKAISLIEKQKNTHQNWMYLQLLFLEAHCNELLGNTDLARKGYEKALKTEPNFKLVRDKYYPDFLKKYGN